MEISTQKIKELREVTGVSIMQCRKALEEALGDAEKARVILRKTSKTSAEKKSDRTLGAGVVASYIHNNNTVGVIVELNCETDFVARNDEFKILAKDVAMHITAMDPENLEELLEQSFIKNPEVTIRALTEEATQKFGERTEIGRFHRLSLN